MSNLLHKVIRRILVSARPEYAEKPAVPHRGSKSGSVPLQSMHEPILVISRTALDNGSSDRPTETELSSPIIRDSDCTATLIQDPVDKFHSPSIALHR